MHSILRITESVRDFLQREDGPTTVEYAVMGGFIIAVCFVSIGAVGTRTLSLFVQGQTLMP